MENVTLRKFPFAMRLILSCFLITVGIGYLSAITYLFLIDIEPHRKTGMGLTYGVIVKYYGNRENSRLEASLRGSMGDYVSPMDKELVIQWIRKGAKEEDYSSVKPIIDKACADCHSKGGSLSPLTNYSEVSKITVIDFGQSIKSLSRVSHVHLFGISLLFLLTGVIFSFSEINRVIKTIFLVLPFASMWVDIGSWWLTKFEPVFAYTVIIGGMFVGMSLAVQILVSLYEMWLRPVSLR